VLKNAVFDQRRRLCGSRPLPAMRRQAVIKRSSRQATMWPPTDRVGDGLSLHPNPTA